MSSNKDNSNDSDNVLVNGKECVHCGLWFKLEKAKLVPGTNNIRCPNCDWMVEGGKG